MRTCKASCSLFSLRYKSFRPNLANSQQWWWANLVFLPKCVMLSGLNILVLICVWFWEVWSVRCRSHSRSSITIFLKVPVPPPPPPPSPPPPPPPPSSSPLLPLPAPKYSHNPHHFFSYVSHTENNRNIISQWISFGSFIYCVDWGLKKTTQEVKEAANETDPFKPSTVTSTTTAAPR